MKRRLNNQPPLFMRFYTVWLLAERFAEDGGFFGGVCPVRSEEGNRNDGVFIAEHVAGLQLTVIGKPVSLLGAPRRGIDQNAVLRQIVVERVK